MAGKAQRHPLVHEQQEGPECLSAGDEQDLRSAYR